MNTSPVTQILREKLVVILWLHKWVTGGGDFGFNNNFWKLSDRPDKNFF